MSETTPLTPDQVEELLALRAAEGLDASDQQVFDQLVKADPAVAQEAEAIELAAAQGEVALRARYRAAEESLPDAVRGRLLADASAHLGRATQPELKLSGGAADKPAQTSSPLFRPAALGWYAAAAAAVALMFVLSQRAPDRPESVSPGQQYATLKADPATVAAEWGYNPDGGDPLYANAAGEVIFNADTQTGYMKLTGLPVNDPTKQQYQLWIVDATRSDSENTDRVDGGVFDVTASGEVIVPIDAKLDARQPVVFAITVETPGGVVESKGPLHVVAVVE